MLGIKFTFINIVPTITMGFKIILFITQQKCSILSAEAIKIDFFS